MSATELELVTESFKPQRPMWVSFRDSHDHEIGRLPIAWAWMSGWRVLTLATPIATHDIGPIAATFVVDDQGTQLVKSCDLRFIRVKIDCVHFHWTMDGSGCEQKA